jgi:hypothetical protein
MLHIQLGFIIQQEREREIEENLRRRRLLADIREPLRQGHGEPASRRVARQERAGVAS